jgi:hypothetical protein
MSVGVASLREIVNGQSLACCPIDHRVARGGGLGVFRGEIDLPDMQLRKL